jgi:hypothetical protein
VEKAKVRKYGGYLSCSFIPSVIFCSYLTITKIIDIDNSRSAYQMFKTYTTHL